MNNNYGLKIYYISTMIMAILIVIAIITNYYLNKSLIFSKALNLPTKYNQHFDIYNNLEINTIKSFIYFISNNKEIENLYVNRDKNALYASTKPILDSLSKDNSITHFYFIDKDSKVFLRVHNFNEDNDYINRYIFNKAKNDNTIFAGNEFGKMNTFTLRVVQPWIVNNSLIGYLELGKEIDKLSNEMTKELGVDVYYFISKKLYHNLNIDNKEHLINNEKYILAYHTNNSNYSLDNHHEITNLENKWIYSNNKIFVKTSENLYDVSNQNIGYKIFLIDVTDEYLGLEKKFIFYTLITAFCAFFMIMLGYILSSKKQKELNLLLKKLESQKIKFMNLYLQQKNLLSLFDIGESILFNWNNDDKWSVKYVSKNVVNIFGYSKREFLENKIKYSNCIYEEDKVQVSKEIEEIINSKKIYYKHKPYRIVTKSRKIKWIRDYTITIRNSKNEIINFLGYIVDITNEYEVQQNLQKFIDTQDNIVILTDGKVLNFANKKMFDFLGFKNLDDFLKKYNCICELFIKDDKFFHLGKISDDEIWVDEMMKFLEPERIVQIENLNKIKHIFAVSITNFDEKLKIVSFSDITQTINQQIKLEEQNIRDNLTGAYNRNYFDLNQSKIIDETLKSNQKLAVAIIDIDYFKKVNDTYGHDVGDYILKQFVHEIKNSIRHEDILIRWGGEEFLLLLKITKNCNLEAILNNIRINIQNKNLTYAQNLTCSIGATIHQSENKIISTIKNADINLYKAKKNGRNQVVLNIDE